MAAFSEFAAKVATRRHVPRERIRLAVAITLSSLVHLWLAGGVTVRAPGHATTRGPAIISARLEIPVTPPVVPSPPQDGAKGVHENVPDSRRRARPADERARETVGDNPSPSSAFVDKTPDAHVPASALPAVSDPEYYPARQLDVYPALMQPVNLDYPRHAATGNVGGRVLLMVLIDETGGVRELSIIDAGPARFFEDSLRAAFSEARFSPARKDGRAVKSRVLIGVDYRPGEVEGTLR